MIQSHVRSTRNGLLIALAAFAMTVGACHDHDDDADASDVARMDAVATDGTSGNDGSTDSEASTSALTDSQIVAVTAAADTGEIDQGTLAMTRATSPAVQSFATEMVNDHTMARQQMSTLATTLGLTPQDNAVSMQLTTQSSATLTDLQARSGSDFDNAYMAAQVVTHRQVLSIFDSMLIPDAMNAQLRTQLQTARAMVAMHLAMAEAIVSGDGGVSSDGGASDGSADGGNLDAGDGE